MNETSAECSYFGDIHSKKVVMFGPLLPPPYGGVSVHIQRVTERLRKQNNSVFHYTAVCEYRYRWFLLYLMRVFLFLVRTKPDVIYYHTLYLTNCYGELWLLVFLKRFLGYELITVDHNSLYEGSGLSRVKDAFNASIVPHLTAQLIIGQHAYQQHKEKGISTASKIIFDKAFLAPLTDSHPVYPAALHTFVAAHDFIIVSAVTHIALRNGKDVYGLDFMIELMKRMKQEGQRSGLVCCIGSIYDVVYYAQLSDRIQEYGLASTIFLLKGAYPLWPLFNYSHLFLRPTLTDGGITISEQEAHYFGVPVVASDVCLRHPSTVCYKTGSVDDCYLKVSEVVERGRQASANLQRHFMHSQSP